MKQTARPFAAEHQPWLGLEVTAGGEGIVSHAGLVLLRQLADMVGLSAGLSKALASRRLLVHDRSRVPADLACRADSPGQLAYADDRGG